MNVSELLSCPQCSRQMAIGFRNCPFCGFSIVRESSDLALNTQIPFEWADAYVQSKIGEGGMGAVYRAWLVPRSNPSAPLPAAVKVLLPSFARQSTRDALANEARVLASLAHPNIVRFFGLSEVNGLSAIAMEYVQGETLGSIIERKAAAATEMQAKYPNSRVLPCLPFDRAWHYFQQLLGALASIHAMGVVHRDVKPDNVLIATDGTTKLTDFGIARLSNQHAGQSGNLIAGTVAYMSPEQVQGFALDGRSDLYSAAIVLYELLTGKLPFPIDDRSEWMVACDHVQSPPAPLRRHLRSAPSRLEDLIARGMAKNPADRFADAIAFGEEFRATLGLPDDAAWDAQRNLVRCAVKFSNSLAAGDLQVPTELASARNRLQTAYMQKPLRTNS